MSQVYLLDGINPEPWTSPTASVGRSGGRVYARMTKSRALTTYQEAIREAIQGAFPTLAPTADPVDLTFYLWRQRTRYKAPSGRMVTRQAADATNMQKALEDALQGVLYANDRQVRRVTTHVMAQGPEVEPAIIIQLADVEGNAEWVERLLMYGRSIARDGVAGWDELTMEDL